MPSSRARRTGATAVLVASLLTMAWVAGVPVAGQDASSDPGWPRPALQLAIHPRIDPARLRVTTFAAGLPYTTAMQPLPDGALLVATSTPRRRHFNRSTSQLVRLTDHDLDGSADDGGTVVADDLPGGIVQMVLAGELLIFSSWQADEAAIGVLRPESGWESTWQPVGALTLAFPEEHLHDTYGIAVRATVRPGEHELFFNLGSRHDAVSDPTPIVAGGLLDGLLPPESVVRVTVVDTGDAVRFSDPVVVATGLRNAAAMAFDPVTGDLVVTDNGFDDPAPHGGQSADELNVIPAAALGVSVPDFGFSSAWVGYPDGTPVGDGGVDPRVAFTPAVGPDAKGIAGIAFAPEGFPDGLAGTLVVGFHGGWADGGAANRTNPVLAVDWTSGSVIPFVPAGLPGVGHLDTIVATQDALFLADINVGGDMGSPTPRGAIHRIAALP